MATHAVLRARAASSKAGQVTAVDGLRIVWASCRLILYPEYGSLDMTNHESAQPRLPAVPNHPTADVVIYDGACQFCVSQMRRIARWDGEKRFVFISLHDSEVAERYPDLTYQQLMDSMHIVDRHARRHHGAAAFRYLTRRLPRLWILAPFLHLPFMLPVWQWCYRKIASRRYAISQKMVCDENVCKRHVKK